MINTVLTVTCCRALKARDDNKGNWPNGEFPLCFFEYRDKILPHLKDWSTGWFVVVESHVKDQAVKLVCDWVGEVD